MINDEVWQLYAENKINLWYLYISIYIIVVVQKTSSEIRSTLIFNGILYINACNSDIVSNLIYVILHSSLPDTRPCRKYYFILEQGRLYSTKLCRFLLISTMKLSYFLLEFLPFNERKVREKKRRILFRKIDQKWELLERIDTSFVGKRNEKRKMIERARKQIINSEITLNWNRIFYVRFCSLLHPAILIYSQWQKIFYNPEL